MSYSDAFKVFAGLRIVVIGDIMLDRYTFGDVERVSPEAGVPIVLQSADKFTLGGAANVASNIAALGATPILIGVLGDDPAGQILQELLQAQRISHHSLLRIPGRRTTEKQRIVSGENHQLLRLDRETAAPLSPEQQSQCLALAARRIAQSDAVIFSDYAKGFFDECFAQSLVAIGRREKKLMLADFNPRHKKYFLGVDLITPNLKEARELTGLHEVEHIGPHIVREMSSHAVITRGGEGMSLFTYPDASHFHAAGRKIRVFDVSGAGDTSIAVMALGMSAGLSLPDAVILANTAGSLVVQKPGTATLTVEELASLHAPGNHVDHVKLVTKLWGYEQWLENNEKYCCKILTLKKGYQCSLHYHKIKDEMFLVTSGHMQLELGTQIMHLHAGSYVRIPQNTPHRFAGIEDSIFIEVSTHHEESDSYRLEESRAMDPIHPADAGSEHQGDVKSITMHTGY